MLSPIADGGGKNARLPGSQPPANNLGGQKAPLQLIMAKTRHKSPRTAMHYAEMTVLLNAVLDHLPGLRLDRGADDPHIHGLIFRSPPNLPVRVDLA